MRAFKRKIYSQFLEWKNESDGNTALLVEGARRIGKSTTVEEFGKNEYRSYILIDFAFASNNIKNLFYNLSNDSSDLDEFFTLLQFYTKKNYLIENHLLFLMKFKAFLLQDKQ